MRNARRADIEYNRHDRNCPLDGPIARRLKEYGRVKAFVVGPRARYPATCTRSSTASLRGQPR